MLSLREIKKRLWDDVQAYDERKDLVVMPEPRIVDGDLDSVGLDLHLGSWFCTYRELSTESLAIEPETKEGQIVRQHYVPINRPIIVHPGQFVLGITLEWLRFPNNMSAHVVGKSSWGRRGLIIATATGVQPSFNGCLTLEIANVGRAPIKLLVGMPICQLFFEEVENISPGEIRKSSFAGGRKPTVGTPKPDWVLNGRI
ncbi:dCTP deaminase [Armatimonadetes bacterium Uphvl-Ar1]|nr:dCTP deaminase [Armatimonadetes bacterium Uphvl-Ar1]